MKNTKVSYMYRDGSNYKFHGEFILQGIINFDDIKEHLHESEFFIPHEVGLDHLLNLPLNQDDHYLHTFEAFELVESGTVICSATDFIIRIKKANHEGWLSSFECWA